MQFLCIVPKFGRSDSTDEKKIHGYVQEILRGVDSAYSSYAGEGYSRPRLIRASSKASAYLAVWDRQGDRPENSYYSSGDRWAATAGHAVAGAIHRDVVLTAGGLRYITPVWGSYAAVLGERYTDRVTAWATVPALESIHFGQNADYVYISNRPLIAALACRNGNIDNVRLSDDYLAEYLAYGYSVTGQTPFAGIQTVPVNSAVSVVGGRLKVEPVPSGLASGLTPDHTLSEGAEALASALTSAMDRTQQQMHGRALQVRLSGGKDSRLMLGLLRGREIDMSAITYGVESDSEVSLARRVADMANIPHRVGSPPFSEGRDVSEQTLRTIFECGGMPPSEPHLARNIGSNPSHINDAIMLGQWPLFKGGMAKVVRYPEGGITKALVGQISPLVSDTVREEHREKLLTWANEVHAASELEKLYLFAREFRSGRYLHSHITHYARDAQISYPISDAEVTAISDDLTMYEKVSQKSLFLAMRKIWPESLGVPLHNSIWRFEAGGETEISGPDYTSRYKATHATEKVTPETKQNVDGSAPGALASATINELCFQLISSPRWNEIQGLLNDKMRDSITASAGATGWQFSTTGANYSTKEFSKYVWRVYVADRWLSREWMAKS